MHGPHVGIWRLSLRNGTKYSLQVEEKAEMDQAVAVPPSVLGQLLSVRV
jgi:hypothetical protein